MTQSRFGVRSPNLIAAVLYVPLSLFLILKLQWNVDIAIPYAFISIGIALLLAHWLHRLRPRRHHIVLGLLLLYSLVNSADFVSTFWDPLTASFSVIKAEREESNLWYAAILSSTLPAEFRAMLILALKIAAIAAFGSQMTLLVDFIDLAIAKGWTPGMRGENHVRDKNRTSIDSSQHMGKPQIRSYFTKQELNGLLGAYVFSTIGLASHAMVILAVVADVAYEGEQLSFWNADLLFDLLPFAKSLVVIVGIVLLLAHDGMIAALARRRADNSRRPAARLPTPTRRNSPFRRP